eukprot:1181399-Prorocentrum_minimum.AAC.2
MQSSVRSSVSRSHRWNCSSSSTSFSTCGGSGILQVGSGHRSCEDPPIGAPATFDPPIRAPATFDPPIRAPTTFDPPIRAPTTSDSPIGEPAHTAFLASGLARQATHVAAVGNVCSRAVSPRCHRLSDGRRAHGSCITYLCPDH